MRMRLNGVGFAAVALAAVACGERTQSLSQGPSMQIAAAAPSDPTVCDFRAINKLVTSYFGASEAKVVKGFVSLMETAGAGSEIAKDRGFDVMVHIASNVNAGNPKFTDASSLTNALLPCMFTSAADRPANFPEDFTVATDPAQHGGYAVRGSATDPTTSPVLSRPLDHPFSGIAPPGSNTWAGILGSNPAPKRVLVYGRPGSRPLTYDWKVVPRSTVFSPEAVVGVCVDAVANSTSLLHEENIGLLPFVDVGFLVPGICSPTALQSSAWPLQVARSFLRWGADLLGPRALSASSTMDPGGLGGSTGGIRSEFGPEEVDTVTLSFAVEPSDVNEFATITPAVQVLAVSAASGNPVPNASITLAATNNNGTPAQLLGTLTQITNGSGIATFTDLSLTKTGGYLFVASGGGIGVIGRPAIVVVPDTSARFNVRP